VVAEHEVLLVLLAEVCHERDVGVLLVTHDPQAVAFADHVHALRDGRLVAYEPDRAYAPFDAE
jgi:ABC-type lipoprotein export system ATPase subunit